MHYAYLVPCFSLNLISVPRRYGGHWIASPSVHIELKAFCLPSSLQQAYGDEWLSLPCFSGARTWTRILKSLGTTLTWQLVQTSVMFKLFSKGNADDLYQEVPNTHSQ